jgi:hypothetical protein
MLKQSRIADAQTTADRAVTLSKRSGSRQPRFDAELASARVLDASGKSVEALKRLEALLAEAKKCGYLNYEYEARLALGEVEMKAGKPVAGRARLSALHHDATSAGFHLIARETEKAVL